MQKQILTILGAILATRQLLAWSKAGQEDDPGNNFIAKMQRPNFLQRVLAVMQASAAPSPEEAAAFLQEMGWFSGIVCIIKYCKTAYLIIQDIQVWKGMESIC